MDKTQELMPVIDFDKVMQEVEAGYINVGTHPSGRLKIFNYSPKAQFDWRWTAETMACRGLITDLENNLVARPFPKFFSYDQLCGNIPDEPFEAFEKMDGSLGILYWLDDEPHISTRGSFVSHQAYIASAMLIHQYSHVKFDRSNTYLFEIIYPENRIVVDYGDRSELVLLAVIDTETGVEQPIPEIDMPVAKRYDIDDIQKIIDQQDDSREGFVVRFESGQRVKFKFDEYLRLHKLLTGVGPRHIWELLRSGSGLGEFIDRVPDEFYQWVRETENDLMEMFCRIESEARGAMAFAGTRKEIAERFTKCKYPSVMFAILDGKDYREIIWKMIKPSGESVFKCESLAII